MQNSETTNPSLSRNTFLTRIPRPLLIVLVSLIPLLATLLLFSWLQADLRRYLPLGGTDYTWMWHQVLTFREVGFDGGYYVVNEMPAAASFIHFSSWGPVFPMVMGTIAKLIGWEVYTGILFNITLLTVTIGLFLTFIPFDRPQIILTGLVLLTLTPILMYLPLIAQESFHQSAAFFIAGVFYILMMKQRLPRPVQWICVLLLIFLSILRFSWVIFFVPLFLLGMPSRGKRGILLALLKTALLAFPVYLLIGSISAPGGNFLFAILRTLSTDPLHGIRTLLLLMLDNVRGFLLPLGDPNTPPIHFVQAVQFVVLFVGLIVVWRRPVRAAQRLGENFGFHIYNLTIILMLSLFFYRSSGYYRIFAIHLLVTLLLLIGFKHYRLVGIFIIIGLIGAPVFFNNYKGQHDFSFHPERDAVKLDSMRATFEQEMVYKPDASNAWCNTVLIPTQFLDYHVLAVPAKIGISFLWFGDVNFPLKSHYLLFDEATYQDMRNRLRIEPLAVVSDATLYRNLDSGCVDG